MSVPAGHDNEHVGDLPTSVVVAVTLLLMAVVAAVYLAANASYYGVLSRAEIQASPTVAAGAMGKVIELAKTGMTQEEAREYVMAGMIAPTDGPTADEVTNPLTDDELTQIRRWFWDLAEGDGSLDSRQYLDNPPIRTKPAEA